MTVDPARVQTLKQYFAQYIAQGYTSDMVRTYLIQNNFATIEEVDAALTNSKPTTLNIKSLIVLSSIALILVLGISTYFIFLYSNNTTSIPSSVPTSSSFADIDTTPSINTISEDKPPIKNTTTIQSSPIVSESQVSTYQEQGSQPAEQDSYYYNQIMK